MGFAGWDGVGRAERTVAARAEGRVTNAKKGDAKGTAKMQQNS